MRKIWNNGHYRGLLWGQQCHIQHNVTLLNISGLLHVRLFFAQKITVVTLNRGLQCDHIPVRNFVIQPWTAVSLNECLLWLFIQFFVLKTVIIHVSYLFLHLWIHYVHTINLHKYTLATTFSKIMANMWQFL